MGANLLFVNNVYCQALIVSLDEMAKLRDGCDNPTPDCQADTNSQQADANYQHIILATSRDIPGRLPDQVGKYHIEYLDNEGMIGRYRALRKPFAIIKIRPINKHGERRKISFIRYWIHMEQGDVIYSRAEWSNVYFSYDKEKHEFLIEDVEVGGV